MLRSLCRMRFAEASDIYGDNISDWYNRDGPFQASHVLMLPALVGRNANPRHIIAETIQANDHRKFCHFYLAKVYGTLNLYDLVANVPPPPPPANVDEDDIDNDTATSITNATENWDIEIEAVIKFERKLKVVNLVEVCSEIHAIRPGHTNEGVKANWQHPTDLHNVNCTYFVPSEFYELLISEHPKGVEFLTDFGYTDMSKAFLLTLAMSKEIINTKYLEDNDVFNIFMAELNVFRHAVDAKKAELMVPPAQRRAIPDRASGSAAPPTQRRRVA